MRLQQALTLIQQGKTASALKVIGPLHPADSSTPADGQLAFLHAVLPQEQHGVEAALEAFNMVLRTYPPLADYAAQSLAEAATSRDDHTTLEALLSTLTQHYPYSLHLPSIHLLLATTYHRLGDHQRAHDAVVHVLQTYPSHPSVPDALFLRAQLEEKVEHIAKAAITFKSLGYHFLRTRPNDRYQIWKRRQLSEKSEGDYGKRSDNNLHRSRKIRSK
jgi:TolA-binding protein